MYAHIYQHIYRHIAQLLISADSGRCLYSHTVPALFVLSVRSVHAAVLSLGGIGTMHDDIVRELLIGCGGDPGYLD